MSQVYELEEAEEEEEPELLMVVKKEGHTFSSKLINPIEEKFDVPVSLNFEVKPIEVGTTAELNDIYFATASFDIDNKSLVVLDSFIEFLKDNPRVKIEIRGHTDNIGSPESNMKLSKERAESVKRKLIEMGIEKSIKTLKNV